jgi:hypothetical protein
MRKVVGGLFNPMCKFSGGNHLSQVQRRVAKVNGE